ncbi:MAG: recombinase family protein [Roseiarcus sp.]
MRETQAASAKSLTVIAAASNGRGIPTARDGQWEVQSVANVLRRVA